MNHIEMTLLEGAWDPPEFAAGDNSRSLPEMPFLWGGSLSESSDRTSLSGRSIQEGLRDRRRKGYRPPAHGLVRSFGNDCKRGEDRSHATHKIAVMEMWELLELNQ
ncbi:MAG: hypothetical protein CMN76_07180 [Spirochaetaceae bacterium]|nr:hypothetical protein [Spirochaetaceae bacterium]